MGIKMNSSEKQNLIRMILLLAAIVLLAGGFSRFFGRNVMSLSEYAAQNRERSTAAPSENSTPEPQGTFH